MIGRAGVVTAALAAAVLGAGAVAYRVVFPDPPAPVVTLPIVAAVPPDRGAAPVPAFEVAALHGTAWVGTGAQFRPLHPGERLYSGETIRTGADGQVTLRTAAGDALDLRERVTLEVTSLSRSLTELTLMRGKVRATPSVASERFAISAGSARAEAPGGARFIVYADDAGSAFVASEEGDVRVVSAGRSVKVASRQQTAVADGAAPGDPIPVPAEVFVSVSWPEGKVLSDHVELRGQATPGSVVRVNGAAATVRFDGSFTAPVALRDGANTVEVHAEGLGGGQRDVRGTVRARTVPPPLEADPSRMYQDPPLERRR